MKDETFGEVGMPKSLQGLEGLFVTLVLLDVLLARVLYLVTNMTMMRITACGS
jgi:hypothetical protein